MNDKLNSHIRGNVKISLTDDNNNERIVSNSHNIIFDRIYNQFLNFLRPWNTRGDIKRRDDSYNWAVHLIRVGSGHIVLGDPSQPLPPAPEWADPYMCITDGCSFTGTDFVLPECPICGGQLIRNWDDIELPLKKGDAVVKVEDDAGGGKIKFLGVYTKGQANGEYITEAGLYLKNGDMIAINTFRGFKKTADYGMKIEWDLKFI